MSHGTVITSSAPKSNPRARSAGPPVSNSKTLVWAVAADPLISASALQHCRSIRSARSKNKSTDDVCTRRKPSACESATPARYPEEVRSSANAAAWPASGSTITIDSRFSGKGIPSNAVLAPAHKICRPQRNRGWYLTGFSMYGGTTRFQRILPDKVASNTSAERRSPVLES